MKKALAVVFAIAVVASVFFKLDAGFGGGHGTHDLLVGVLALPWILIPWPESFVDHPFLFLIILPLLLNCAVVVLCGRLFANKKRHPEPR